MTKATEKMQKKVDKLEWYVVLFDFNHKLGDPLKPFNIFHSYKFSTGIAELLVTEKNLSFDELLDKVRREAMYAFWSKCEYEILVSSWPPSRVYDAELTAHSMTIKKRWFSKNDIELEVVKGFEENNMKPGRYYVQHLDDDDRVKIDVYEQIKPNLKVLTEYIVRETDYKLVEKEKKERKESEN